MDLGRSLLISLFIISKIQITNGQTYENVSRLMTQLLDGYDKRQRPVLDQSKPVVVNVSFELLGLKDIDELGGKFSIATVPVLIWSDEKLRWNPALHDDMSSLAFPKKDIWYPKLELSNSNADEQGDPDDDIARVYAFGWVVLSKRKMFEATCSINVRYYPFDTQVCYLSFSPHVYMPNEVTLQATFTEALTSYYVENGEWTYSSSRIDVHSTVYADVLVFIVAFERQASFLIVNILLPILLMATMNILVFVIPPDAGERISYSVTVLLALAVYLTLVGDNLPKTSQPIPLFCYYLTAIVILSVTMCIATILNLRIYHKDENSNPPGWCRGFTNIVLCRCYRNRRISKETRYRASFENGTGSNSLEGQDRRKETAVNPVTWKDVSFAFDIVLFILYVVAAVVINVYYMVELQSFDSDGMDFTSWMTDGR